MAEGPLGGFTPAPGFVGTERPALEEELYATPDEMRSLYGLDVTEEQLRFAQSIMDAHCGRNSLWPEEYTRQFRLMPDRNLVILPARPVLQVVEAKGRFNYGRRDHLTMNNGGYDVLAALALTNGPGIWTQIDVDGLDVNGPTGEVWLQPGLFLLRYSEVLMTWQSGLMQIPARVKAAMAEIVHTVCQKGVSDRTRYRVGRTDRQYASSTFMTEQAANFLQPYVIQSLF